MLETIIVVGIVAVAAVMEGRLFYRSMTGKKDKCVCIGNCPGCACKDFAEMYQEWDVDK